MRVEAEVTVQGSPQDVFAWWTDYGEVGHEETVAHGLGWSRRRVLSREPGRVVLEERLGPMRLAKDTVELDAGRLAFRESSDLFEAWWTFEEAGGGRTRVRRVWEARTRAGRLAPAGAARWGIQRDLAHHAREFERSHQK